MNWQGSVMAKKITLLLSYPEAEKIIPKKLLKNWDALTGDFSKKRNKSFILFNEKTGMISGSSYPNRKSLKTHRKLLLNNKKILRGFKIVEFKN